MYSKQVILCESYIKCIRIQEIAETGVLELTNPVTVLHGAFAGKRMKNGSNVCGYNSAINALLNLKMIRNFVMADEPLLPLKTELKSILTSTFINSRGSY